MTPKLSGLKQQTFIISQLPWVSSSLAGRFYPRVSCISWGDSCLRNWLGVEDPRSGWLTPVTLPGGLPSPPAVGRRRWALATRTSHSASPVTSCQGSWLSPEWVIQQRARQKSECLFWPSVASYTHYSSTILLVTKASSIQCGREPHEGVRTGRWESLETGSNTYH